MVDEPRHGGMPEPGLRLAAGADDGVGPTDQPAGDCHQSPTIVHTKLDQTNAFTVTASRFSTTCPNLLYPGLLGVVTSQQAVVKASTNWRRKQQSTTSQRMLSFLEEMAGPEEDLQDDGVGKSLEGLLSSFGDVEYLALRQHFGGDADTQIRRPEFVDICTQAVLAKYPKLQPNDLNVQAEALFLMLDQKGLGWISWESFSSHLIDSRMAATPGSHAHAHSHTAKSFRYSGMIDLGDCTGDQAIESMGYVPDLQSALAVAKTGVARLINRQGQVERTFQPPSKVLSADYNKCTQTLTISAADSRLLVYKCSHVSGTTRLGSIELRREMAIDRAQTIIKWGPMVEYLYSGDRFGDLCVWKCANAARNQSNSGPDYRRIYHRDLNLVVHRRYQGLHSDTIKDILVLPGGTRVMSCSLDSRIIELDLERAHPTVRHGHSKGVISLAHNEEHGLLFSAGFEYYPFCWYLNQPTLPPMKLGEDESNGHRHPLLGVQVLDGTHYVVSADVQGTVKVWDVRMFKSVETFTAPPLRVKQDSSHLGTEQFSSFAYIASSRTLCLNGFSPYLYHFKGLQTADNPGKLHSDETPLTCCVMHHITDLIVTAAGSDVKIFNLQTGVLKHCFEDIVAEEIRCLCLDAKGRRFYVGTGSGLVVGLHTNDGSEWRTYPSSEGAGEVLHASIVGNHLITASVSGAIVVWPDPDFRHKTAPLRVLQIGAMPVSLHFSNELQIAFVGTDAGTWMTLGLDGFCLVQQHRCALPPPCAEAVCAVILSPLPLVCFSDDTGGLHAWTTRPYISWYCEVAH